MKDKTNARQRARVDIPPPPNAGVVLVLLPNMLAPVLPDWPPKMLPVFVLEPNPGDAEGELDRFGRRGASLVAGSASSAVSQGRGRWPSERKVRVHT
jgi:hypothetical protein